MSFVKETQHLNIPLVDIQVATNNFSTIIGKGGYGKVYKGQLSLSGTLTFVAVKRLDNMNFGQGLKEFLTEIHMLSSYKHPNLISLIGFCNEGNEKILVYEYAEYGSLDRYLSNLTLTWMQRINICLDAARGLDYLHNQVAQHHRVIHRDIKSANILLDRNWKAMISDLGLSKLGRANENETFLITNACGTLGYCDPEYIDTGILTKKSDVYSFGVVLFEVLCGRLCFMNVHDERRFLAPLARRYYEKEKLDEIINPDLRKQMNLNCLNMYSMIAYQCLLKDREQRPSMDSVVEKLEKALECQVDDINDEKLKSDYPLEYSREEKLRSHHPAGRILIDGGKKEEKGRPLPKFGEGDETGSWFKGMKSIFRKLRYEKKTDDKSESAANVDFNTKHVNSPAKMSQDAAVTDQSLKNTFDAYRKDAEVVPYIQAADAAKRIQAAFREHEIKRRKEAVGFSDAEYEACRIIAAMKIQHAFRNYERKKQTAAAVRIQRMFLTWKMR